MKKINSQTFLGCEFIFFDVLSFELETRGIILPVQQILITL